MGAQASDRISSSEIALFETYLEKERRARPFGKVLLTTSISILVGAVLFYFAARWFERTVVFHPERYSEGMRWRLPEGGEDVWFTGKSGERLHGWYVRAKRNEDESRATVLYFHGNGGNISYIGWLAESLASRGFDVLLFDYRGYGKSEGGPTDERGIYEDADAAYDYLLSVRRVRPEQIVLYGQSLGTTAAVDLAARKPCGAVILESGLSSASDMASLILPWAPRWLHQYGRNHFESVKKLAGVRAPLLVSHGARDRTIPVEQGYKLYEAAHEPKRLLVFPGGHHRSLQHDLEVQNLSARFIEQAFAA